MSNRGRSASTTVNLEEVDKFSGQSIKWWSTNGESKALHSMNALRVPLIRDGILQDSSRKAKPLSNFNLLDVGCGGGVLSEPLARLGANVTGLDASPEMIAVAQEHAQLDRTLSTNLKYRCESVEEHLSANQERYDAIIVSEVAEHVDDLRLFLEICVNLTKENGSLFFTTINKTPLSWLLAIFTAENILKLVPRGTHSYDKLVEPAEVERILVNCGCRLNIIHGMCYNPIVNSWRWIRSTDVNYALHAIKMKNEKFVGRWGKTNFGGRVRVADTSICRISLFRAPDFDVTFEVRKFPLHGPLRGSSINKFAVSYCAISNVVLGNGCQDRVMANRKIKLHSFFSVVLVVSLILIDVSDQAETRVERRVDNERRSFDRRLVRNSIRRQVDASNAGERRFRREDRQREGRAERETRRGDRRERMYERGVSREARREDPRLIRLAPFKEMENYETRVEKIADNSSWDFSISLLLAVVGYTLMTPANAKLTKMSLKAKDEKFQTWTSNQHLRALCVTCHGRRQIGGLVRGRGVETAPRTEFGIFQQIAQLADHLYLSGARAVQSDRIVERDVTCIVNATVELPNLPIPNVDYLKVPVNDTPHSNLYNYFDVAADKIEEIRRKGGKTLVHCIAGVSRSVSLCLAYLMKYEGMSLRTAYSHVKARRPIAHPNRGFFKQLIDYEMYLFGQQSVRMIQSESAGLIPDVYADEYRNIVLMRYKK
uniref:Ubiquinone biosynthesis O-methyltransferase, mitochondrial n=1 Tax=Strigamia maritima TaxID=126957 RepID=T1J1P0_STRMM